MLYFQWTDLVLVLIQWYPNFWPTLLLKVVHTDGEDTSYIFQKEKKAKFFTLTDEKKTLKPFKLTQTHR